MSDTRTRHEARPLTHDECDAFDFDASGRWGYYVWDEHGDVRNDDNGERCAVRTPNGLHMVYDEDAPVVAVDGVSGLRTFAFPLRDGPTLVEYVQVAGFRERHEAFDAMAEVYEAHRDEPEAPHWCGRCDHCRGVRYDGPCCAADVHGCTDPSYTERA